jgi:hypothetical protein
MPDITELLIEYILIHLLGHPKLVHTAFQLSGAARNAYWVYVYTRAVVSYARSVSSWARTRRQGSYQGGEEVAEGGGESDGYVLIRLPSPPSSKQAGGRKYLE